jgi:hypothetical protein
MTSVDTPKNNSGFNMPIHEIKEELKEHDEEDDMERSCSSPGSA